MLGVILIGNIFDERLYIADKISFGSVLFALLIFIDLALPRDKMYGRNNSVLLLLYMWIIGVSLVTLLINSNGSYALNKIVHLVVVYPYLFLSLSLHGNHVRRLLLWIYRVFLLFLIIAAIKVVSNGGVPEGDSGARLSILGGGPIVFSRMMAVLFLLNWTKVYSDSIVVRSLIGFFSFIGMVLAGSKAPIIFLIGVLAIYNWRLAGKYVGGLAALIVGLFSYLSTIKPVARLLVLQQGLSSSNSFLERRDFIADSFTTLIHHPIIPFGVGQWSAVMNTFVYGGINHYPEYEYPHNFVLEMWIEIGFLGLMLILFYLLRVIFNGRIDGLKLILIFYIMSAMTSGDMMDFRHVMFWAILCTLNRVKVQKALRDFTEYRYN